MIRPSLEQRDSIRSCPEGESPVMHQRWEKLLFLHWEMDPEVIQNTLPSGLYVDTYEGKAYVGIVPFYMRNISPRGFPAVPYLSNFLECNVRTYVHDERGVPGVWFYSLEASRWIACMVGRTAFHLPYFWAEMKSSEGQKINYELRRRGAGIEKVAYDYEIKSELQVSAVGSLEFFLLERYLLYARRKNDGEIFTCRVHHEPYRFCRQEGSEWSSVPCSWNGLAPISGEVAHACAADAVDVDIFAPKRHKS